MRKETLYIGTQKEITQMCTTNHIHLKEGIEFDKQLKQINSTSNKTGIVFMRKNNANVIDKWFVHLVD